MKAINPQIKTSNGSSSSRLRFILAGLTLACSALLTTAQAVTPAPDGGYPGGNTAEGQNALLSLTIGTFNTAVGFLSLKSDIAGQFNTAIGAGALFANVGDPSVFHGILNTAIGAGALLSNNSGERNTAIGAFALFHNTTGSADTAHGDVALFNNTTGGANTAIGDGALNENVIGNFNTALGTDALLLSAGNSNTAVGSGAGQNIINANNVICIGQGVLGQDVNNSCYIGSIWNQPGGSQAVYVNSDGKLGALVSSRRFKDNIQSMDKLSNALFSLHPVSFRYKKEIDPDGRPQFGLVAEEVDKVNRDLVLHDKEGKPYSVRYDQVNAMLLNEFLKDHKRIREQNCKLENEESRIQQQEVTIAELSRVIAKQEKTMKALAAHVGEQDSTIQRVTTQIETTETRRQVALNSP